MFTTFTTMKDILEEYLEQKGFHYCHLDGRHNLETRNNNIEEFRTNPNSFIFLISTHAGGLGLNLIEADTVIFYNIDWV